MTNMNKYFSIIVAVLFHFTTAHECGCKSLRPCYKQMLDSLLGPDEDACIENVAIGASTITIFLKALNEFCERVVKVYGTNFTYEGRILYEVVLDSSKPSGRQNEEKPVIMLEAGQDGGTGPVALALFVIEQLVACGENKEMTQNVQWVILPSTNPDGHEYVRTKRERWKKNFNPNGIDKMSFGVDITRNFDDSWEKCSKIENIFSQNYPGRSPGTEIETMFVTNMLAKYKAKIKTYLSLRGEGHAILHPLASGDSVITSINDVAKRAGVIAAKVNQRAGSIQWFVNQSIYKMNGKSHCGHSVDYAFNKQNIPYSFEMRVFPESDNNIMSKFQYLPKGYEMSLRSGYFSGIKELYNVVVNEMSPPKKN